MTSPQPRPESPYGDSPPRPARAKLAKPRPRVIRARKPGQCPRCNRYIHVGDQIAHCGIWLCIHCALDHLEQHHQDGDQ